jgi:hypothetical protein
MSMDANGCQWMSMNVNECQWASTDVTELHCRQVHFIAMWSRLWTSVASSDACTYSILCE